MTPGVHWIIAFFGIPIGARTKHRIGLESRVKIVGAIFNVLHDRLERPQQYVVVLGIFIVVDLEAKSSCEFMQVIDAKARPVIGSVRVEDTSGQDLLRVIG